MVKRKVTKPTEEKKTEAGILEGMNDDVEEIVEEEQPVDLNNLNTTNENKPATPENKGEELPTPEFLKCVDETKNEYNKAMRLNKILGFVVVLIGVGGIIVTWAVLKQYIGNVWTSVIVICLLIGVCVYNFIGKKKIQEKATKFITEYYNAVIKHLLDFEGISEVKNTPIYKMNKVDFSKARAYAGVELVTSRNLTTFKYLDKDYRLTEMAAQVLAENKRPDTVFVGKFIEHQSNINIPGRILIVIKGTSKLIRPVDDVQGLEIVAENKKIIVYSNYQKYSRILTKEVLETINRFNINKNLFDMWISIVPNTTYVGLDLSNEAMDLPADKPYNVNLNNEIQEYYRLSIEICALIDRYAEQAHLIQTPSEEK